MLNGASLRAEGGQSWCGAESGLVLNGASLGAEGTSLVAEGRVSLGAEGRVSLGDEWSQSWF